MGYKPDGTPRLPEADIDIQATMPDTGSIFDKLKVGFIKMMSDVYYNIPSGLLKSDNTLHREVIDDIIKYFTIEGQFSNAATQVYNASGVQAAHIFTATKRTRIYYAFMENDTSAVQPEIDIALDGSTYYDVAKSRTGWGAAGVGAAAMGANYVGFERNYVEIPAGGKFRLTDYGWGAGESTTVNVHYKEASE